jgi:hypothetical protein
MTLLCALLTLIVNGQAAAAPLPNDETPLDAPFTVVAESGRQVRVDIGTDRRRARLLRRAVLLTRSGPVPAMLVRAARTCTWVCGERDQDNRVCHYEAVLRAAAPFRDVIAVLPGRPDVRNIAPLVADGDRTLVSPDEWIDARPIAFNGARLSWKRLPDGVFLTSDDMGRDVYAPSIDLADCVRRTVAPFTVLVCRGAELLYEGTRGIVASFADYSKDTVEPEIRFQLDGREAVLIRLGLKAEVVAALLVRQPDGTWRIAFREVDYPLMC